jgi:hypothetical protein
VVAVQLAGLQGGAVGAKRGVRRAADRSRAEERFLPRLYLRVVPDAAQVGGGLEAVAAAEVLLCDAEGRPVAGELLARARLSPDGLTSGGGALVRVPESGPGRFRLVCAPEGGESGAQIRYAPPRRMGRLWTVLGVQLKAYAEG